MNKTLLLCEKYLGKFAVVLLGRTWRLRQVNFDRSKPAIYIFWHRNALPLIYIHRYEKVAILASNHKDGELISGPAEALGYLPVRGSSTRGGREALIRLIALGKKGYSLAITPDGPKGPPEQVKEGAVFLAQKTGLPLICAALQTDRAWEFNSWDKFRIPKPFASVRVEYSAPFYFTEEDTVENFREKAQKILENLTKKISFAE